MKVGYEAVLKFKLINVKGYVVQQLLSIKKVENSDESRHK